MIQLNETTMIMLLAAFACGALLGLLPLLLQRGKHVPRADFDALQVAQKAALAESAALRGRLDEKGAELQKALQNITRLETLRENDAVRLADHAETERKAALHFENLANRIFDDKAVKFKEQSQAGLGAMLDPLKEKLVEFQKKVDESFGQQAKEQFSLKNEIQRIVLANEKITTQAENLTQALKGESKTQGNWGEVLLEKILEDAGLRKDEDYVLQATDMDLRHAETGGRVRPDAIVKLPEGKHIVIDAKVSLTHYERFASEDDRALREPHLKQFLASVRNHVNGLSGKRYADSATLGTPDFVLMFLPVEGAYALAVQEDRELHSYAWDKKVVVVCASTLFAALRTIASVWRMELRNLKAEETALLGGRLYDKVAGFVADMGDLGKKLGAAQESYDEAMKKLAQGRGNILTQAEKLRAMGAKTSKQLPSALLDDDLSDYDIPPIEKAS